MDSKSLPEILAKWEARLPEDILFHEADCCATAKSWFGAMAMSVLDREAPLRWLAERWTWGPGEWPMHWCVVLDEPALDCSALASLGEEAMGALGRPAFRVQAILDFGASQVEHWRHAWEAEGASTEWLSGRYAYHEILAVADPGQTDHVRLWDPSVGAYLINRRSRGGPVALRLWANGRFSANWQGTLLPHARWVHLT